MIEFMASVVDIPKGAAQGGIVIVSMLIAVASVNAIKNMGAILVAIGFGVSALSSVAFMFNEAVYPLISEFEGVIGVDKDLRTSRDSMDPVPSMMGAAKGMSRGEILHLPTFRFTGGDAVNSPQNQPLLKWLVQGTAIFLAVVTFSLTSTLLWWLLRKAHLAVPSPEMYRVLVDGDLHQQQRAYTYHYPILKAGTLVYDLRRAKKMDKHILKMPSGALLAFEPAEKEAVRPISRSLYRAA
jgi:hypothetical protein